MTKVKITCDSTCDLTQEIYSQYDIDVIESYPVSVEDYYEKFSEYTKKGCQIVHISISGELSKNYENACIASKNLKDVFVVDSKNFSTGAGQLVLLAAELANADYSAKGIAEALINYRERLDL